MPSVGQVNGKFHYFELTNSNDLISGWHDSSPKGRPEICPTGCARLCGLDPSWVGARQKPALVCVGGKRQGHTP